MRRPRLQLTASWRVRGTCSNQNSFQKFVVENDPPSGFTQVVQPKLVVECVEGSLGVGSVATPQCQGVDGPGCTFVIHDVECQRRLGERLPEMRCRVKKD